MVVQVYFENVFIPDIVDVEDVSLLKSSFSKKTGILVTDIFITVNGRRVSECYKLNNSNNVVRICSRLVGGKGGFGSMLRAIGAQIEKTTNREACRDLSGRRLRDINEEKRLRKWLDGQADREREAAERKLKKLERLVAAPKIDVKLDDPLYEKERQELPERVSAAVDAGWQVSTSKTEKRKLKEPIKQKNKKKAKLWIDADLSECSMSDDEEGERKESNKPVSTDSDNESDRVSEISANTT